MNKHNPAIPLLPCPFCGSEDIDPEGVMKGESYVTGPACDECGATTEFEGDPQKDAGRWNKRKLRVSLPATAH